MIAYRLFLLLDWILMHLPKMWRKRFFTAISSIAHRLASSRNKVIQANLNFAFGDSLSLEEKKEIEAYCYRNLLLNFLQTMENRKNSAKEVAAAVTFENREGVDALLKEGKGIIFVSAHFGNWELGGAALSSLITPVASIYREFSTSEFDPYLLEARTNHRMELVEKNGALKHIAKALRSHRSILLMIDQAISPRSAIQVDFFGHPTYHIPSAAQLSAKFNAPIVGIYIIHDDEEHYTVRFEDPIETLSNDEQSIVESTQKQIHALESLIRRYPKLWFWCHKRWKKEAPEIYS